MKDLEEKKYYLFFNLIFFSLIFPLVKQRKGCVIYPKNTNTFGCVEIQTN